MDSKDEEECDCENVGEDETCAVISSLNTCLPAGEGRKICVSISVEEVEAAKKEEEECEEEKPEEKPKEKTMVVQKGMDCSKFPSVCFTMPKECLENAPDDEDCEEVCECEEEVKEHEPDCALSQKPPPPPPSWREEYYRHKPPPPPPPPPSRSEEQKLPPPQSHSPSRR